MLDATSFLRLPRWLPELSKFGRSPFRDAAKREFPNDFVETGTEIGMSGQ
jgi:hypothetical protein